MKLNFRFLIASLLCISQLSAQKKEVDTDAIKNTRKLGTYGISNDGNYIWYTEQSDANGTTFYVCTNDGRKKASYENVRGAAFTSDSKYLAFEWKDDINVLELPGMKEYRFVHARNPKVVGEGNRTYLCFRRGDTLTLRNLSGGEERRYTGIRDSYLNKQGTALVLYKDNSLIWVDIKDTKERFFFTGPEIRNVSFNATGSHLIFSSTKGNSTVIYEYHPQASSATILVDDRSKGKQPHLEILKHDIRFSDDGNFVFFKLRERTALLKQDTNLITKGVSIWSFRDKNLQSEQSNNTVADEYTAVIALDTRDVVQLENDHQTISGQVRGEYVLLKNKTHEFETYWNGERVQYWLLSLRTGEQRDFIPSSVQQPVLAGISPKARYITWRDDLSNETFCYTIKTGKVNKIAAGIIVNASVSTQGRRNSFEVSGWLKDDAALIGYDSFDVWQVDPENKSKPVSITGKAGRKNGIQFRPVEVLAQYELTGLKDSILLTGMEVSTKYSGFTKVKLSAINAPGKNFLGPYLYYFPGIVLDGYVPPPMKSNRSSAFLLQRQSDISPSNIFFTKDFRHFIGISDIQSEPGYKGYVAELIQWTNKEDQQNFGVLYRPEDLDPAGSYPIIFNYYESRSFERYQYKVPALSAVNVNVPWYVSRDYVIFIPDMNRMRGKTGQVALETIEGAAKYLTGKYTWIDKRRMGLQGHSHGGYLTNYITTHSNLFAAAQSSAGYSDFISGYGLLAFGGISMQFMHEVGQNNLGATPFQNTQTYIDNSCIFTVDKVTTPLLLMHNQGDGVVSFEQSIELFTALRRVSKPVWLLEYDNEDHVLSDPDHILDFCTRQQQFFDHYLRGKPAPKWMTSGLPAVYKGIYSGLEIDSSKKAVGQ
ncbi:alpha/beta hydrolase family protein [Chitinophaga filiformis]|uniref:Prolyl oligopeptidase family protein n=1 Tax=Chitinophaga filiformis TaxID=104663 RepID=A0A1G7R4N9_CHIFI|nr:prolyl oligopeptidase family serine peptidase [Chitinophaga filiformis]SDG05109.1 Prolyl oligopeptidase family protein [Chitinophaga filiformis]